jgi:hypothetical protein
MKRFGLALVILINSALPAVSESHDGGKAACEAGDAKACYKGATNMMIVQSHDLAFSLFQRACDGGVGDGCHFVGRYLDRGEHVAQDSTAALTFFVQACELESTNSCYWAADMFRDGDNTAADVDEAGRLFALACAAHRLDDCDTRTAKFVAGTETFTEQEMKDIEMMGKRTKRMCRSIISPC